MDLIALVIFLLKNSVADTVFYLFVSVFTVADKSMMYDVLHETWAAV